jgi:hypothetical protein
MEYKKITPFRKPKRKTTGFTPEEKLMKSVGNLSDTRYYSYTPNQKSVILKAIKASYTDMIKKWEKKPRNISPSQRKNFWDDVNDN